MKVQTQEPLMATRLLWRSDTASHRLTVVCKLTCDLKEGELEVLPSAAQERIYPRETYWVDDAYVNDRTCVRIPADLVPVKTRAEVVLCGTVCAPHRKPTKSLVARVELGPADEPRVSKALEIFGQQTVIGGVAADPETFTTLALTYELSARGPAEQNPAGLDAEMQPLSLPQFRPVGAAIPGPGERMDAVGFGPIAPSWPARKRFLRCDLGTMERFLEQESKGDLLLEDLCDPEFFNIAPDDQSTNELHGGERLLLANLLSETPVFETRLPSKEPCVFLVRNGKPRQLPMKLRLLVVDTCRRKCTLTWIGVKHETKPMDDYEVLAALIKLGAETPWTIFRRGFGDQAPGVSSTSPDPRPASTREISHTSMNHPSATQSTTAGWSRPALPFQVTEPTVKLHQDEPLLPEPAPPTASLTIGQIHAGQPSGQRPMVSFTPAPSLGAMPADQVPPGGIGEVSTRALAPAPREVVGAPLVRLDLLWFDPELPREVRARAKAANFAPSVRKEAWLDRQVADSLTHASGHNTVLRFLLSMPPTPFGSLPSLLDDGFDSEGLFRRPLAVVSGQLKPLYDGIARLKAVIAVTCQHAGNDVSKQAKLNEATDYATAGWRCSAVVADRLSEQLLQAVRSREIDTQVDQHLLEQRSYRKLTVFGAVHICLTIQVSGTTVAVPIYVPESVETILPMLPSIAARLVIEPHTQQEARWDTTIALRGLALSLEMGQGQRVGNIRV